MTIRIAMWSGPRNLSTAMMRSFGSRSDTFVSDEPFYGAYLRDTRDPQPMADEVVASMDCDWQSVAQTMVSIGIDMRAIATFATLRDALRHCMGRLGEGAAQPARSLG